jgi:hypothetical protein
MEEWSNAPPFLTSAPEGGDQLHVLAALLTRKEQPGPIG